MFFTSVHEFSLETPLCHAIKTHVMLMKPNWDKYTVTKIHNIIKIYYLMSFELRVTD